MFICHCINGKKIEYLFKNLKSLRSLIPCLGAPPFYVKAIDAEIHFTIYWMQCHELLHDGVTIVPMVSWAW